MLNSHSTLTSGATSIRGTNQKSSLMLSKGGMYCDIKLLKYWIFIIMIGSSFRIYFTINFITFVKIGITKKEHQQPLQQRINLIQIKKAIDKHLDDRKGLYWNTFIKYLQAKLSKTEWDHFVKITFGYEFIALHNYFIKSLLCNAKISTFHHLNGTSSTDGTKRKNRGINNMMMLMEKELLHLSTQNLIFDNLCLHTSTSYNNSKSVNLSNEKHYTKDLFETKMNKIANELGVMNVDSESVNLLYYATEYYMKNLITKCLQQKKQKYENYKKPQIGSYLVKDGKYTHSYRHYELPLPEEEEEGEEFNTNGIHEIDKHVITPRDFSLTIQASPNLIDDIKLREKAMNMDWDLYY